MVDWNKLSKNKETVRPTDPLEIYDKCDRSYITGTLRETQKKVLQDWFNNHYDDPDVIVKMHTGEGKTLVGLLMLQSKMNKTNEPCLYICPNNYLVKQVCDDAKKFGISVCCIDVNRELPEDFLSGKKILVTNVQKMFNGMSKFGIDGETYEPINTVLLDDSHTCVESIRSAFTITLDNNVDKPNTMYKEIVELFKDDLINQREGTFANIMEGDPSSFMVVPYWNWHNKKNEVIELLSKNKSDNNIKFAWPLIKDSLSDCICCVSSSKIEISPYEPNVSQFSSFSNANQRILMSATTQDDSYSIKWLNFDPNAVRTPLMNKAQRWYGEKMIVLPSIINQEFDEDRVRTYIKSVSASSKFGTLVIVPSKKMSSMYDSESVVTSDDIINKVSSFKEKKCGILTVVNRYDGIDFPDDSCRLLVMDSLPFSNSLSDRYEEYCRTNSKIINKKMSQKIEQGLGRGVRGEKDYCVIILIGPKLVKFLKSSNTRSLFSPQTQKQIEIGMNLAEQMKNESESDNFDGIIKVIDSCLKRNEGWKQYYLEEMDSIKENFDTQELINIFEKERKIQQFHLSGSVKAIKELEDFINTQTIESEMGWYLQTLARYYYLSGDKTRAMEIQQSAFEKNHNLLRPSMVKYKKMDKKYEQRNQAIINLICNLDSLEDFKLQIYEWCDSLVFTANTDDFEKAVYEIGKLLGFKSGRPDKESGRGPDNLWQISSNKYFIFECKNGVKSERRSINKKEAAQMDHSCEWFKNEYPSDTAEYYLIHPARSLDCKAVLNKDVRIIGPNELRTLKKNLLNFVNELCKYDKHNLTTDIIQKMLSSHDLNPDSFQNIYSKKPDNKMKN